MITPRRPPVVAPRQTTLSDLLGSDIPDWPDAPCIEDPEAFFPNPRSPAKRQKEACNGCGHRSACLERALDMTIDPAGVWGGKTELERRRMRKRRTAKAAR